MDLITGDPFSDSRPYNAIQNEAYETLKPGPEVDECRPVYVVQRNESFVSLASTMAVVNSVNAFAWKGCGPRTVKCKSIVSGQQQTRNNYSFYSVTYEFHLNPQTWDIILLNQGTRYLKALGGGAFQIVDFPDGKPHLLYNRSGAGDSGTPYPTFDAQNRPIEPNPFDIYIRFRYYTELDFNSIFSF